MVHGHRTNRPLVCGGPCTAAALLLLAATLLHAVLALGVVRGSPSAGLDPAAPGASALAPAMSGSAGVPASAGPAAVPTPAGVPVSVRALAVSTPAGVPVSVRPLAVSTPAGVPASARAFAVSTPAGAPTSAGARAVSIAVGAPAPASGAPETEEERSTSGSVLLAARDGAGHPARHGGRVGHGASSGAHRSLATSPGPLVLVAVRARLADHATGDGAFGAGSDFPAGRLSSRSVVLRC